MGQTSSFAASVAVIDSHNLTVGTLTHTFILQSHQSRSPYTHGQIHVAVRIIAALNRVEHLNGFLTAQTVGVRKFLATCNLVALIHQGWGNLKITHILAISRIRILLTLMLGN